MIGFSAIFQPFCPKNQAYFENFEIWPPPLNFPCFNYFVYQISTLYLNFFVNYSYLILLWQFGGSQGTWHHKRIFTSKKIWKMMTFTGFLMPKLVRMESFKCSANFLRKLLDITFFDFQYLKVPLSESIAKMTSQNKTIEIFKP